MNGAETASLAGRGERQRHALSRVERILTALIAALLGNVVVGFIMIGGQMLVMQRQMLGMQRQIGDLRTDMIREIGKLRTEISALSGPVDVLSGSVDSLADRMTRVEGAIHTYHGPLPSPPDRSGRP